MTVKKFHFAQPADLRIEGVGLHASYSITVIIQDKNTTKGKEVLISATGKSNAAKAAGSGTMLFWCRVKNMMSNEIYILKRNPGEHFAVGMDNIVIGSTIMAIPINIYSVPQIEIEAGYFYDSGYTGTVPPFPGSIRRIISLTPFVKRY